MTRRAVLVWFMLIALSGGAYAVLLLSRTQAPIRSGPLVAALMEARMPGQRRTDLTGVFDIFIPNSLDLEDRILLLEREGFHCSIRSLELADGEYSLWCDRPLEDSGFCEGFSYFSQVIGGGEAYRRIGTDYFVDESRRDPGGWCRENQSRYLSTDAK